MKNYRLNVKLGDRWVGISDIVADSHAQALRAAMAALKPEQYDKPIRLEQIK